VRNILWNKLEVVIFDVDGTLYDQSKLRKKMMLALLGYYFLRPWKYKDLLILHHFRKEREGKSGFTGKDLQNEQYQWCADRMNISLDKVKVVIDKWIFDFPNKYLKECMYPGVDIFFETLDKKKISKAIYSDYDSIKKMKELGLSASFIVSSTDRDINSMKPLPKGLDYIVSALNINDRSNCLFLGDREELDGLCAESANIPFLLIDKKQARINLYEILSKKLLNEN
jgi:FMN phosphatase YigB (HAD superfamily)